MQTYHLHADFIARYADDLLGRLRATFPKDGGASEGPDFWVCLGASGDLVSKALLGGVDPTNPNDAWIARAQFETAWHDRQHHVVTLQGDTEDPTRARFLGKRVLLVDSHVNTGETLLATLRAIRAAGAASLSTYAVAVKTTSGCIPNHFSIVVGPYDRVLVPADADDVDESDHIANNRMRPTGTFRRLAETDLHSAKPNSGQRSLDRAQWSDYWYDVQSHADRFVLLYEEADEILGFISYTVTRHGPTVLDEVAVDQTAQGRKIASNLMRWVETHARAMESTVIELWAIDVDTTRSAYRHLQYAETGARINLGPDGFFWQMTKPVLYGAPR